MIKPCFPISLINKADTFELQLPDSYIYFSVDLEFRKVEEGVINYHPITPQYVNFLFWKTFERQEE